VIVLMPPLSIEGAELQRLVAITRQAIEAATAQSLPLAA
jgi:adenosylmethionine-8-amino-7-oxononanoate aminotransferase